MQVASWLFLSLYIDVLGLFSRMLSHLTLLRQVFSLFDRHADIYDISIFILTRLFLEVKVANKKMFSHIFEFHVREWAKSQGVAQKSKPSTYVVLCSPITTPSELGWGFFFVFWGLLSVTRTLIKPGICPAVGIFLLWF